MNPGSHAIRSIASRAAECGKKRAFPDAGGVIHRFAVTSAARRRTANDRIGETSLASPFASGAVIDPTVPGVRIPGGSPDVWHVSGVFVPVSTGLFVRRRRVTPGVWC
jgi:hypothetical protein